MQSWEDLETIWTHIVEQELQAEAAAQPMLVTQMPLASAEDEARMAEILVESLGVPAMFVANKSVMSLYGGGNMTGISVDSGHDTTYLVPSYQGNAIQDATLVLKIGGKQVTESLMMMMMMMMIIMNDAAGDGAPDEPPDEWQVFLPRRQLPPLAQEEEDKIYSVLEERNHQGNEGNNNVDDNNCHTSDFLTLLCRVMIFNLSVCSIQTQFPSQ